MRTANEPRALRAATSTLLAATVLLGARAALASSPYPGEIAKDLGLSKAPPCVACHDTASGGAGTANKPFAKSMKDNGLAGGSNTASVKAALDALAANKIDSDGDGTPDTDELVAGTDPNAAPGEGGGPSPAAPDPTYGCVAEIAPRSATGRGAWLPIALVGGAAVVAAARRRPAARARRSRLAAVGLAGAAIVAGTACYETSFVSTSVCSSGLQWTGGDRESPNMNPGHACIACHTSDEGPRFTVAGTVYDLVSDADSCIGTRAPVTVVITGADGKSIAIDTNESGNFYTREPIALPYRAMVVANGKQAVMDGAQTSGDCNACHTATGANKAAGRILPP